VPKSRKPFGKYENFLADEIRLHCHDGQGDDEKNIAN